MSLLLNTLHFSLSNTTLHPALHRILISMRDAIVMPSAKWPIDVIGSPGMLMSQMWVDETLLLSGKLTVMKLSVPRRYLTDVPFIMKINAAPVSVIACVAAIAIAFANSNPLAFVEQLDATIMASLLSSSYVNSIVSSLILLDWVVYNEWYWHNFFFIYYLSLSPHTIRLTSKCSCASPFYRRGTPPVHIACSLRKWIHSGDLLLCMGRRCCCAIPPCWFTRVAHVLVCKPLLLVWCIWRWLVLRASRYIWY